MITIRFDEINNCALALDDNREIGRCEFIRNSREWTITHTEVNSSYGGRGIAERVLRNVLENARLEKVRVIPVCSYAVHFLEKHPEYQDLTV